VSSLLAKKTAKQAKARWNEYLDPRIRKSDWQPEEDEKLLNLSRLLPNQWRSIASTLGRTATQCVERYQRLLDETSGISSSSNDLGLSGPGMETSASIGGSRDVQIGDLNVDAETKEARPDAVDLDDYEKEMVSEARARLANTKGKKATRKARERMLEESKRIALLQKRRELKQSGINTKLRAPRKKYATQTDYNADIPFEHRPSEGFYDTKEEIQTNDNRLRNFERQVNISGLKKDAKRKDKRSRDEKKQQEIEKSPVPSNEEQFKKRKLNLPEPELKEDEVTQLAKKDEGEIDQTFSKKITRAQTSEDKLKTAAEKVREYTSKGSALLTTEEEYALEEVKADTEDQSGKLQKTIKISISDRLAKLPQPKNDFEILLDKAPEKEKTITEKANISEDEGEKERLRLIEEENERQAALLRRSQAVQKNLPIPDLDASFQFDRSLGNADQEMIRIMRSDFSKIYKIPGVPLIGDLDEESRSKVLREMEGYINKNELAEFQNAFKNYHTDSYNLDVDTSLVITELQGLVESCNRLEKKLNVQLCGYINRHEKLQDNNIRLLQELSDVDRAEAAFQMLYESELVAAESRQETLREEVDKLVTAEQRAQELLLELKRDKV
jgi:pre-mRNA-splicing factor CDC5/CEF1